MHELYQLKDKLMDELKEYAMKDDMSAGDLEVVDKLTHTVKNLCKICEDEGYSERYYSEGSYRDGSYRGNMRGESYGGSYRGRGRNARRDSMGRYASADEMSDKLRELMESAPDDKTRVEIQRLIAKLDQM